MSPKRLQTEKNGTPGGSMPRGCGACGCRVDITAVIGFVDNKPFMINTRRVGIGQTLYLSGKEIGKLSEVRPDRIFVKDRYHITHCYRIGEANFALISTLPDELAVDPSD